MTYAIIIDGEPHDVSEPVAVRALDAAVGEIEALRGALVAMAERFDGATNGKCHWCGAGRVTGGWDFSDMPIVGLRPLPCTNERCGSHAVRAILSPET